jgi:hypothetical protein
MGKITAAMKSEAKIVLHTGVNNEAILYFDIGRTCIYSIMD